MPNQTDTTALPAVVMPEVSVNQILKGQKALVTGANSGIGKAVAIALGHAGADVVINYVRGDDEANAVAAEASKNGTKAYAHKADVSNEDDVHGMFEKMKAEFGTIDILVANAGLQMDSPIDQMTLKQWQTVININLTGQFLCAARRCASSSAEAW